MDNVTVENDRIRVTVIPEIWNGFEAKARQMPQAQNRPAGEPIDVAIERIQRGLVLSEAMKRLAHADVFDRENTMQANYKLVREMAQAELDRMSPEHRSRRHAISDYPEVPELSDAEILTRLEVEWRRQQGDLSREVYADAPGAPTISPEIVRAEREWWESNRFCRRDSLRYHGTLGNLEGWEIIVKSELPEKIGSQYPENREPTGFDDPMPFLL